jgi:ABC-type multidrug transport system ATPase subunit
MGRPRLLLLDEPTTGLDPTYSTDVEALIREQRSAATTVVLSSHDLGFVERVCTQVVFLVDGQVRGSGPVSSMVARFGSLLEAYGATAQASATVRAGGARG